MTDLLRTTALTPVRPAEPPTTVTLTLRPEEGSLWRGWRGRSTEEIEADLRSIRASLGPPPRRDLELAQWRQWAAASDLEDRVLAHVLGTAASETRGFTSPTGRHTLWLQPSARSRPMPRPAFLASRPVTETGADLIAAFRAASSAQQAEADRWLLVNSVYGSLTWQEQVLFAWIEEDA